LGFININTAIFLTSVNREKCTMKGKSKDLDNFWLAIVEEQGNAGITRRCDCRKVIVGVQ